MTSLRIWRNAGLALIGGAGLLYSGLRLGAKPDIRRPDEARIGKQPDGVYFVPTGQTLTPAGRNLPFAGRPVDMALSPDGRTLALMLAREVRLFDVAKAAFRPETLPGEHSFGGIAWSPDGKTLYTTGSARSNPGQPDDHQAGAVFVTRLDENGQGQQQKPIFFALNSRLQPNLAANDAKPAGLALSPDGRTLYVSLFNNGTLATVDLTSYDAATGAAKMSETPVGSSPERLLVNAAGDRIYVANRGGKAPEAGDTVDKEDPVVVDPDTYKASTGTVSVVDAAKAVTDAEHAVTQTLTVGLQPVALALSPDGKRLFTANANGDTVSVFETATGNLTETIPTSPAPGRLAASCPNGLAVAPDGHTLYVTLGGDNAVEALTLGRDAGGTGDASKIAGLIPTAWFPLGITRGRDGTLYVANSKGIGSLGDLVTRPRSAGAAMPQAGPGGVLQGDNLIGHSVYAVMGSLEAIAAPDTRALARGAAQVARNNHFDRMEQALNHAPDPFWSRFKHAILVIKENRTYDQILGDMPVPPGHLGGDSRLVMFGEKITPNQHALARAYGLFDNLYCSGAISADGHHWLNEAFADDYSERAMNTYPRSYPCCGTDPLAFAGSKFLWQAALDAGRTFRNYGEFGPLPSIQRHSDLQYDAPYTVTADRNQDVAHFERILADLNNDKIGLAQYTSIWFGNNHTSGTRPGAWMPESDIADNDLALGKLVDTLSHSRKYWRDEPTAIFVVEDDAQGGLDHVEGHRTTAFVISPYGRRNFVCSTNYNQLNLLRTIEQILSLKPLNQFDAAAIPMRNAFSDKMNATPYTAVKNNVALNLKNPPLKKLTGSARHWAAVCAHLDFSAPDRADPELLTETLWHHTHPTAAYPPHSAASQ